MPRPELPLYIIFVNGADAHFTVLKKCRVLQGILLSINGFRIERIFMARTLEKQEGQQIRDFFKCKHKLNFNSRVSRVITGREKYFYSFLTNSEYTFKT